MILHAQKVAVHTRILRSAIGTRAASELSGVAESGGIRGKTKVPEPKLPLRHNAARPPVAS